MRKDRRAVRQRKGKKRRQEVKRIRLRFNLPEDEIVEWLS